MVRKLALLAFAFHALFLPAQDAQKVPAAAFVVDVSEDWTVHGAKADGSKTDDAKKAVPGMKLSAGQVLLRNNAESKLASITILYLSGERESCPSQRRPVCSDLKVRAPAPSTTGVFSRIFLVLLAAYNSDPESVPGLTKSSSIPDGYAELTGNSLSLQTPGLAAHSAQQTFKLQLRRLDQSGHAGPPVLPQGPWHPGSAVEVPAMSPGLYRVNLLDSDSEPTGDFFVVLVLARGQAGNVIADFNALVAQSESWGPQAEGATLMARRLFLWQSAKDMNLLGGS
jgi:hypothetical protein